MPTKRVTVIGGGFTGSIFAHHLLRESHLPVSVDVVEERSCLGAGVAYSAGEAHQITNIPVARMSVFPDDPTHFERWLQARSGTVEGEWYPSRASFGAYMNALVRSTQPTDPRSRLRHVATHVRTVEKAAEGFLIETSDGRNWRSDVVALATGNPSPAAPRPLAQHADDPRVIIDPWVPGALARIGHGDRVLFVGAGLTTGEMIAGLNEAGHHGAIVAISRHGRRPERAMMQAPQPFGAFKSDDPATARALLHLFRHELRRAKTQGLSWRSVASAARAEGWNLWMNLPVDERRRFVRHIRPFYEAIRHVMPGPVYDMLDEERHKGRLRTLAASLTGVEPREAEIDVTLHLRGSRTGDDLRESFDRIVNCTGPAYAALTRSDPLWAGLARNGLVAPDPVGLGIDVDRFGRAHTAQGKAQPDLLVLGTLARGTFGELNGVPELSRQACEAACTLVSVWSEGTQAGS